MVLDMDNSIYELRASGVGSKLIGGHTGRFHTIRVVAAAIRKALRRFGNPVVLRSGHPIQPAVAPESDFPVLSRHCLAGVLTAAVSGRSGVGCSVTITH